MGIFARLKASFQGKEDADRYLKGLDKSKRHSGNGSEGWRAAFAALMKTSWKK